MIAQAAREAGLARVRVQALRDASADAERNAARALSAWHATSGAGRRDAHAGYLAALEREQHAAIVLAAATEARR